MTEAELVDEIMEDLQTVYDGSWTADQLVELIGHERHHRLTALGFIEADDLDEFAIRTTSAGRHFHQEISNLRAINKWRETNT